MRNVMCVAVLIAGCMTTEEIPQATARIEGVEPCIGCRDPEAVLVTVAGDDALPGATIVVYDLRVTLELGQRPAFVMRADSQGKWHSVLRSLRIPRRVEIPILPGDVLEIFQKDGEGDSSVPYRITVPMPEEKQRVAPPIVRGDPDHQASDPGSPPAGL
jgi:hypothetical protein